MFNNKKIKDLEQMVEKLFTENTKIQKSLDNIIDTLESKEFSKDWGEYVKWKEMKNKLPDIEVMYKLKNLKKLINKKERLEIDMQSYEANYLKWDLSGNYGKERRLAYGAVISRSIDEINQINIAIRKILKYINQESNKNDLIDMMKLYSIKTDWLLP
jgi:hypothetical protein